MHAEVFSKDYCLYCTKAIKLLENNGCTITVMKVIDETTKASLIDRVTQASGIAPRSVPQIFLDGEYIGGYAELAARFAQDSVA